MKDLIDLSKRAAAKLPATQGAPLPFLQGPKRTEIVPVGDSGDGGAGPIGFSDGSRSTHGNKIILGHSVRRSGSQWIAGDSYDMLLASTSSHALYIASSGSGKATAMIIPNLLNYTGSIFSFCPKGESPWTSGWYRKAKLGQKVVLLDPMAVVQKEWHAPADARWPGRFEADETVVGVKFNPLAGLDVDDDDFDRTARDIALGLVPSGESSKEQFFTGGAQELIYRIIRVVCGGYAGVTVDGRFVPLTQSLKSVRIVLEGGKDEIEAIIERCRNRDPRLAKQLQTYLGHSDSVEDIIRTAEVATSFLTDRSLERFLEPMPGEPVFDLAMFADPNAKFSIYLVIPPDMMTELAPLVRVVLQLILRAAMRNPRREKILFLLDEMGIGKVENLNNAFTIGRSAGLCCIAFFQYLSQMKALYGANYSGFEANSEVMSYFRVGDYETAKAIAEKVGRQEVLRQSFSSSTAWANGGSTSTSSSSSQWQIEATFDAAMIEQISQGLIGNFIKSEAGGHLWSAPVDYFANPFFNGLWRPNPLYPEAPPAQYRPECTVGQFNAWRASYLK